MKRLLLFLDDKNPERVFSLIYIRLTRSYRALSFLVEVQRYAELHNTEIPYEAIYAFDIVSITRIVIVRGDLFARLECAHGRI